MAKEIRVMETLCENGLAGSSEFLGSFILETFTDVKMIVQFAISLYEQAEYRRSLKHFNMAADSMKKDNTNDLSLEYKIKQYCAQCLIQLKQTKTAWQLLKDVPEEFLTAKNALQLAHLSRQFEGKTKALPYYKIVIRLEPYSSEAIFSAVESGLLPSEIRELTQGKWDQYKWFYPFIEAFSHKTKQDYTRAIEGFTILKSLHPNNLHILQNLAMTYYQQGDPLEALILYKKIHTLDPSFVDGMDVFAFLIKEEGKLHELNVLAHDLLQANPYRSETWAAITMYYDAKSRKEKAMFHIEKAIDSDQMNPMAHYYKGIIYRSLKQYELCISSFKNARAISRDVPSNKALIEAYVEFSDINSALNIAKEVSKNYPNNIRAQCLPAYVYAHSADTTHQTKAEQIYVGILKNHPSSSSSSTSSTSTSPPTCIDAVLGLASLHLIRKNYDAAIKLLKEHLDKYNLASLHIIMGDVYMASEKYDDALIHYGDALKINPICEQALQGVEKIERLLRGDTAGDDNDEDEDNGELDEFEGDA
eukprot:TRINITY_DN1559_c0_g1_i1.p1 TRINITY_DN1559_c0_g1~~TRINITY_DN1559_c0_g1_i1.p1  ORF type:complete len:533 (-),score=107.41 TRINITY_DN1559_c0_g1_i1:269-1867(-)